MQDALAHYKALRDRQDDINDEMRSIKATEHDNKTEYDDLRAKKAHSIDVDMVARYKEERARVMQKLIQEQKVEERAQKGDYRSLVAEYNGLVEKTSTRLQALIERCAAVEKEIRKERDNLSQDQLLAYLDNNTDKERKQKRRKT